MRVDPNQLPSGTTTYFIVIVVSSIIVACWSGQFLPGPEYFTTPFAAQYQPGIYSVVHGFYGVVLTIVSAAVLFASHPLRKRNSFGPCDPLPARGTAWDSVVSLSKQTKINIKQVLVDRDIRNPDAIAFGVSRWRTILMGKGLALMLDKRRPDALARLAHEIGHFKNGDVKYAFLSRSLVQANMLLMSVVFLWQFFHPLRVIIGSYLLFTAPMFGRPGSSPALFFRLHGLQWARYWEAQTLGGLMITAPVFVFWTLLLFLEYRSLLRSRELMADARAASWLGKEALLDSLRSSRTQSNPSILQRLRELASPHPLVATRIQAAENPGAVLEPGPLRFLFLGYLWSLAILLISNVDIAVSILNKTYVQQKPNPDFLAAAMTALKFANPAASCLWIALVSATGATYALIITTLLRSCIARRLASESTLRWFVVTLAQVAAVAAGALLGNAIHPYSQSRQMQLAGNVMLGRSLSGIFISPIGVSHVVDQLGTSCVLLLTAILLWMAAGFIVRGERVRPVRSIEWIALAGLAFLSVFQSYALIWLRFKYPALPPAVYAYGAVYVMVFLAAGAAVTRLISGKASDKGPREHIPPWLASTATERSWPRDPISLLEK